MTLSILTRQPLRGPQERLLSRRGLQIALGWLWLFDAVLQAEPSSFSRHYPLGDLAQSAMGAPGWEHQIIFAGLRPFAPHWPLWNVAAVALQAGVGLCLIRGRFLKGALALSFVWSGVVWLLGEGLGMLPTGFALMLTGAPGPALLYAVLGGLAWPREAMRDVAAGPWSVVWSVLWGGAALLQLPLVYSPHVVLQANFVEFTSGQRVPLQHLSGAVSQLADRNAVAFSAALGAIELLVAVGWWFDRHHPTRWLGLGIGVSVVFWIVGQGLGGILSPGASDPSTAPLVVLLALAGWPRPVAQAPASNKVASTDRARSNDERSTLSSG